MQRKAKQSQNGLSRNQSSIMQDKYVVSSSLGLRMKNSGTSSETLMESWKFRCQQQCFAKHQEIAAGKPAVVSGKARPNMLVVDANERTRPRPEGAGYKPHQDHSTAKGTNSITHHSLVHKFIPMPRALKIPDAKAAVEKESEKLEKISAWNLTKVRSKTEVIDEARTTGAKVHFASLMDICHLKKAEWEAKDQKYKGRVVLRGDTV